MSFKVRFVASSIRPVELDAEDAEILRRELLEAFDEDRLGMPDLIARLHEGAAGGHEMTIDRRQAEELFMAIGATSDLDGLSTSLDSLRRSVERYLEPN